MVIRSACEGRLRTQYLTGLQGEKGRLLAGVSFGSRVSYNLLWGLYRRTRRVSYIVKKHDMGHGWLTAQQDS